VRSQNFSFYFENSNSNIYDKLFLKKLKTAKDILLLKEFSLKTFLC
jgi:hypothetical protein